MKPPEILERNGIAGKVSRYKTNIPIPQTNLLELEVLKNYWHKRYVEVYRSALERLIAEQKYEYGRTEPEDLILTMIASRLIELNKAVAFLSDAHKMINFYREEANKHERAIT